MTRRTRRTRRAGIVGGLAALLTLVGTAAQADPTSTPGQPIPGKTDSQLYAGVGADAFAELSNNLVTQYNGTNPTNLLESFDAVDPVDPTNTANITTKPGCSIARPNGANAGITAITQNLKSSLPDGDGTSFCIDWVRSSRAKGAAAAEQNLTFYAQSRDAVGYATIGNAYAPTTPLTTAQLKGIFECTITDWSEVGGQAGPIHVYLPPDSAATLTFFLQAIGSSLATVHGNCDGLPSTFHEQQNDGRTLNGDPLGVAPYAVTKWAAQSNADLAAGAPVGIADNRGGTHDRGRELRAPRPRADHHVDPRWRDLHGAEPRLRVGHQRVVRPDLLQRRPEHRPGRPEGDVRQHRLPVPARGRAPGAVRQHPAGHGHEPGPVLRPDQLTAPQPWWRAQG